MKKIIYLLNFFYIIFAVFLTAQLKPSNKIAFSFFAFWLSMPGLTMIFISIFQASKIYKSFIQELIHTSLVLLAGIIIYVDIIYIHPDAQGALGIILVPIIQIFLWIFSKLIITRF